MTNYPDIFRISLGTTVECTEEMVKYLNISKVIYQNTKIKIYYSKTFYKGIQLTFSRYTSLKLRNTIFLFWFGTVYCLDF